MKRFSIYFLLGLISVWGVFFVYNQIFTADAQQKTGLIDSTLAQNVSSNDMLTTRIYGERQNAITRAVNATANAVVSINVVAVEKYVQRNPFGGQSPFFRRFFPELYRDRIIERQVKSLGSGFLISADGYIVTNEHVVQNAKEIVVTTGSGENLMADLIGVDPIFDVALLKIDRINMPFLKIGGSDDVIIGEWVIAMGNPFGLFSINNKPTVTVGVISAKNRDFGYLPEAGKVYQNMLQTDATINTGNSGGPLLNALGQVIGMNTFVYSGNDQNGGSVGIGFAIPINRIKDIINQLKSGGKVDRHFYTGLEYRVLSAYWAKRLGLGNKPVIVITYVDPSSNANKNGIKVGDTIIEVNGKSVYTKSDIIAAVYEADLKVGDVVTLDLKRGDDTFVVRLKLVAYEK